jgi:hypothetical protein
MSEQTSNQVTPPQLRNPTGKGGFGDNPQNRNTSGHWDSTMSISYQYKRFLKMTSSELKAYSETPDSERTVAMDIAYSQVIKSRNSLNHAKEITDRTEGRAPQSIDMTTGGDKLNISLVEFVGDDPDQNQS